MNFDYIEEILTHLLDNTFSVFCGAGATADATRMSWVSIFNQQTQDFYNKGLCRDIYLLADIEKKYHYSHGNNQDFASKIASRFENVNCRSSKHINAIIDLTINQIWTTNFDTIIETAIKQTYGIMPTIIRESKDILTHGLNDKYIVYKLNGSVDKPSTMVLTKEDFLNYARTQRLFFEMLIRQLVLDSFLFIGYSFSDNLVLDALREINDVFPSQTKFHYRFLLKQHHGKGTDIHWEKMPSRHELIDAYAKYEKQYYEDVYHIRTIYLSNWDELDEYLGELYKRFCNRNVFISGSFRNISRDERIYIERIVDHLVNKLFSNQYNIYSGNGRGLGEIVIARADKYQKFSRQKSGQLVNRPFIFTGDSPCEKAEKNRLIMKDCNTMIIICGQSDDGVSSNVLKQFEQFLIPRSSCQLPLIIPIPSTGYAAEKIFYDPTFRAMPTYQLNKVVFQRLAQDLSPEDVADNIVNIIRVYRSEPNS